jgi:hypothetical protein
MQPDSQISLLEPVILVTRHYKLLKERYETLALLAPMQFLVRTGSAPGLMA